MKHFYLLLASLTLTSLALPQGIGEAEIVYEGHVSGPDSYQIRDVAKAPNGDLVFLGDIGSTDSDIWVVRTTATGSVVWNRTFDHPGGSGYALGQRLAIGDDGKIYIVGVIEGTASLRDFYYLALSPIGIKTAERVVDHFNNDYDVGDIEVAQDGTVLFAGSGLSTERPIVVKMDANLNTLWAYNMGSPAATGNQRAGELEIASDGSVIASAEYHDGSQVDVQFVRLQQNGGLVYEKILGDPTTNDAGPKVMLGSDGYTYFCYTRGKFTLNVQARLSQYDAAGNFQWNKQESGYQEPSFVETPVGEFAYACVQDGGGYSTKFSGFDTSGTILWNRTLTHPNVDFHSLDELVCDDEGYLTALSYISLAGKVDGDWLVTSLTNGGVPLYEWEFDTGVGFYDLPTGIVPISSAEVVVTGFTSSANSETHTFRLRPALNIKPTSSTLRFGQLTLGGLSSLYSDDNDYYEVCKFIVPNQTIPPINVEFDSSIPLEYPLIGLTFETIVKANTPGLQQDTQLWNWLTSSWDTSTLTPLSLAEAKTVVNGLPDPHVQSMTRNVKSRIRVRQVGPVVVSLWCVEIDKVGWRLAP